MHGIWPYSTDTEVANAWISMFTGPETLLNVLGIFVLAGILIFAVYIVCKKTKND